jgi:hypothetical protein
MADGTGATYTDGGDEEIGGARRPAQCPDCFHGAHWLKECRCGCPDGITRKKERDAEVAIAHGDSERPTEGFY